MSKLVAPPFALMMLRDGSGYGGTFTESYSSVTNEPYGKSEVPGFPFVLGYTTDDVESLDLSKTVVSGYDVGSSHLYGQINIGGQVVWDVLLPDVAAETQQNNHFLVCNGPQPIQSGGYGLCTQDWPARVLHYDTGTDYSHYTNGLRLGPKAGSWCAWNRGTLEDSAFELLSHDATFPDADPQGYPNIHEEPKANPHTVWIRGANAYWITYYSGTGGSPHTAGAIIPVTGSPFTSPSGVTNAHARSIELSNGGYLAANSGLHLFGFQATLSSETAPLGAKLGLKLYIDSTATSWEAYRLQDIEQDLEQSQDPLLYTAENVACSGLVYLTAGQTAYVKSSSQYTMEVGGFSYWLAQAGML